MPGAQFAFFTSTYACTICVYENLRTLRAWASIRLRKLEIPNSNRNSTAWVKIAKTYKMHYVNEALRVYCVGDEMAGTVLQAGKPWREHAAPVALLCLVVQQRVSYFFYSPMPFLEAAKMLPIVARASKQSVMNAFKSLNTCLSFTLPISVPSQVLFGPSVDAADKIRAHVRAQNRVCAV